LDHGNSCASGGTAAANGAEKQAEIAIVIRIGLESEVVKEESTC
jgi:hypothetical protein